MKYTCSKCNSNNQAPFAPCPGGREHCGVAHYDRDSFICPSCGYSNQADVSRVMRDGPYHEEMGVGIVNVKALRQMFREPPATVNTPADPTGWKDKNDEP